MLPGPVNAVAGAMPLVLNTALPSRAQGREGHPRATPTPRDTAAEPLKVQVTLLPRLHFLIVQQKMGLSAAASDKCHIATEQIFVSR